MSYLGKRLRITGCHQKNGAKEIFESQTVTGMNQEDFLKFLLEKGAKITIADLTEPSDLPAEIKYIKVDLRYFDQCENICNGMDYVFNLVGIKGSPKMCAEQPADFYIDDKGMKDTDFFKN